MKLSVLAFCAVALSFALIFAGCIEEVSKTIHTFGGGFNDTDGSSSNTTLTPTPTPEPTATPSPTPSPTPEVTPTPTPGSGGNGGPNDIGLGYGTSEQQGPERNPTNCGLTVGPDSNPNGVNFYLVDRSEIADLTETQCHGLANETGLAFFQNGYCLYLRDLDSSYSHLTSDPQTNFAININWSQIDLNDRSSIWPWNCIGNICRTQFTAPFENARLIANSHWQSFKIYSDHQANANITVKCTSPETTTTYAHFEKDNCPLDASRSFTYWLLRPTQGNQEWNTTQYACALEVNENSETKLALNFTYHETEPNNWNKPEPDWRQQTLQQRCTQVNESGVAKIIQNYCISISTYPEYGLKNCGFSDLFLDNGTPALKFDYNLTGVHSCVDVPPHPIDLYIISNTSTNDEEWISGNCTDNSGNNGYSFPLDEYPPIFNYNFTEENQFEFQSKFAPRNLNPNSNQTCSINLIDKNGKKEFQIFYFTPVH
jgi:hypothetical protein